MARIVSGVIGFVKEINLSHFSVANSLQLRYSDSGLTGSGAGEETQKGLQPLCDFDGISFVKDFHNYRPD
jgi:hypothetical protein